MSNEIENYEIEINDESFQNVREYILKIKKYIDGFIEDEDTNLTKKEKLEQFLKTYKEETKIDPKQVLKYTYVLSQYNSLKELSNLEKANKAKLRKIISEAAKRENENSDDRLTISLNNEEQLLISAREILREYPKMKEKDILKTAQKRKTYISEYLKKCIIESIQNSVSYLNEYGILDDYIQEVNERLNGLDFNEVSVKKRNPFPDEYFDKEGNIIEYDEDIGIIESFDEEQLKNMTPEDLYMMDMFWRSTYLKERMEIAKAFSTIEYLDLWDTLLNENEEKIQNIDNTLIFNALCDFRRQKNEYENPKKEEQEQIKSRKIFKRKNKKQEEIVQEPLKQTIEKEELDNLNYLSRDFILQECTIVSKLKARDFSIRTWGVIDNEEIEYDEDGLVVAIDNENFRGTIIMAIPKGIVTGFFNIDEDKLPKYKKLNEIDESYSQIMAKLYLPASNYFKRQIMKKYKENPGNSLYANLTGKKVKNTPDIEER